MRAKTACRHAIERHSHCSHAARAVASLFYLASLCPFAAAAPASLSGNLSHFVFASLGLRRAAQQTCRRHSSARRPLPLSSPPSRRLVHLEIMILLNAPVAASRTQPARQPAATTAPPALQRASRSGAVQVKAVASVEQAAAAPQVRRNRPLPPTAALLDGGKLVLYSVQALQANSLASAASDGPIPHSRQLECCEGRRRHGAEPSCSSCRCQST